MIREYFLISSTLSQDSLGHLCFIIDWVFGVSNRFGELSTKLKLQEKKKLVESFEHFSMNCVEKSILSPHKQLVQILQKLQSDQLLDHVSWAHFGARASAHDKSELMQNSFSLLCSYGSNHLNFTNALLHLTFE